MNRLRLHAVTPAAIQGSIAQPAQLATKPSVKDDVPSTNADGSSDAGHLVTQTDEQSDSPTNLSPKVRSTFAPHPPLFRKLPANPPHTTHEPFMASIKGARTRQQDGGHLVHGRMRFSRSSSLSESPHASPLGPLEKSASGHRWVLVAPHDSSGSYDSPISPPAAQRQDKYEAAGGAAAFTASDAAPHGFLPPPAYWPAVGSAARLPGHDQDCSNAQGAEADSGSGAGGLGSFVSRLRDGFGARRLTSSKRDEAGSAGTQMHTATPNGEAVEMVTFMEAVSDGEGLDPSAAYQMVALRRPTLAQSGIEPSEAQFLLDQANAMLPQSQSQPLMQDNALTALADGIVLW